MTNKQNQSEQTLTESLRGAKWNKYGGMYVWGSKQYYNLMQLVRAVKGAKKAIADSIKKGLH